MEVFIIQRGKLKHCGFRNYGQETIYSLCNCAWNMDDVVTRGIDTDVTCKTCQKRMAKAEYGIYTFQKKRK